VTVDLSPYKVGSGERPISSSKQNNLLTAIENNLNSLPPAQIQGYPGGATLFLNGTGGWTAPTAPSQGMTVLVKYTQKDVLGSAGAQDLFNNEITIPAGAMSANGAIKFWAAGDYLNNTGGLRTISIYPKLGTVTSLNLGSNNITASATRRAWWCTGIIIGRNSTASQQGGGYFGLSNSAAATVGQGKVVGTDTGSSGPNANYMGEFEFAATSMDMTKAQPFLLQAQHSSSDATLSIRLDWARIEVF
jgi:hypothetical protein